MRHIIAIALLALSALTVAGCFLWNQPVAHEKVPGSECFYSEVSCGTGRGCCPQYTECGGGAVISCPDGMCCATGEAPGGRFWSSQHGTPARMPDAGQP